VQRVPESVSLTSEPVHGVRRVSQNEGPSTGSTGHFHEANIDAFLKATIALSQKNRAFPFRRILRNGKSRRLAG
jgi:hypothetical protein